MVRASSPGITDHGNLTGLSDDDHTQYARLNGRSGGQTFVGGTGSAETLNLQSTSHGTSGTVIIHDRLAFEQQTLTPSGSVNDQAVTGAILAVAPTANSTYTGFANGTGGGSFWLVNRSTVYSVTIAHDSSSSSSQNRVWTHTRSSYVLPPAHSAQLIYNASDAKWYIITAPESVGIAGSGYGLVLSNNGTDAVNDIDIAVGACPDTNYTEMLHLTSGLTKRIDASWAVGTGNGGLDTGSVANSTWYHVHLIRRPDTGVVDALFSTSFSSPTMPSNYTQRQRIGSVYRNGGGSINPFVQRGDYFTWLTPILDVDVNNQGTSTVIYTVTVPTGPRVLACFNMLIDGTSAAVYLFSADQSAATPSVSASPLATLRMVGSSANCAQPNPVRTDTAARVLARADAASTTLRLATLGWIDPRWRN